MIHRDDIIIGQNIKILSGNFKGLEGSIIDFKIDKNKNILNDKVDVHIKDSNMVKTIDIKNIKCINPWKNSNSKLQYIKEKNDPYKNLYEQETVYSEEHARELLTLQTEYNRRVNDLNTELTRRRSDLLIKHMRLAQQRNAQKNTATQTQANTKQPQQKQTGTVDTTGRPVTSAGTPPPVVDSYPTILKIKKNLNNSLLEKDLYNKHNSIYSITDVDRQELQNLKNYLDAEDISYIENEESETIEFNENELDKEWQDQLSEIGLEPEFDDSFNILTIEDEKDEDENENEEEEEILTDEDEIEDKNKVIYVKIKDEDDFIVGKIYKLFDDGEWRSKLIDGESDTFEKLNYDPDWDEIDIVAFLRDNYNEANLIKEEEYNQYLGEGVGIIPKIVKVVATTNAIDKLINDEEICEDDKEIIKENLHKNHKILTFDQFLEF